jgi:DinB superfamily
MDAAASTPAKLPTPEGIDARVLSRIIEEGYGREAWHGPEMKTALADVTSELAFWRPAPDRHNIAEIALHHAYWIHTVRARLTGAPDPFVLPGEDWFALADESAMSWPAILAAVESEQRRLVALAADFAAGRVSSPLPDTERFDLVLGITCHAAYHAGQIQLLKRLRPA